MLRYEIEFLFERKLIICSIEQIKNNRNSRLNAQQFNFAVVEQKNGTKLERRGMSKKDVENGAKKYEKWFKLNNFGNYFLAVNIQMLYLLPTTVYTP